MMCVADIMLANNICDVDADVQVGRFTLPYYLGVKNSLRLFALLYYAAFAAVAAMAVFHILPAYVLAVLLMLIFVQKNLSVFRRRQSKAETFPLSVQNLLLILLPLVLVAAAALVI